MDKEVRYKNVDILLMDPAYSRWIDTNEDTELDCVDLVAETLVDGLYDVFRGRLKEFDEDAFSPSGADEDEIQQMRAEIGGILPL